MKFRWRWVAIFLGIGLVGKAADVIWHFSLETKMLIVMFWVIFGSMWYTDLAVDSLRDEVKSLQGKLDAISTVTRSVAGTD